MQAAVLRTLEFDRIRDAVAARALTALGRARLEGLEPATDPADVAERLALTSDAVAFTERGGSLALSSPDDLADILAQLDIQGQPLEPLALLGLARLLTSVDSVAVSVQRSGGARLAAVAARAASFTTESQAVTRAIDPSGEVTDKASPALRDIREALRRQRATLRQSLDSLARNRDTAKYLQDQIVTDRNGRYVLVVRAEHRDAISGLVHGSSTSGASVYVEPLATVALNNEVIALTERERIEVLRILTNLTSAFRARWEELDATLDVAAELDALYAKADLARRVDGVAPRLASDGRVVFRDARHPLLIPAVRDLLDHSEGMRRSAQVVASDLVAMPPRLALVISGPNTGGKTVALKAFGLLALMAQAGLFIPVSADSELTPFATVFADIGDDQSIAASLSTFSAHIARLVHVDRTLALPALVLLDEVGSGTDPAEGGALGASVVDHFMRRGATVVATTHDELLKSYAATTDGVTTAGFGFDPDSYAPTYRIHYGAPGRSLALEIAARLGLPAHVIDDARRRRSGRESLLAAHLERLDQDLARVAHDREAVAKDREALAEERSRLLERESRLAEREAVLKRRFDDRVNEKLREARAEIDRVVGTLKEKASSLSTGAIGGLRAEARGALERIDDATGTTNTKTADRLTATPKVGDRVLVRSLGAPGVVQSVSGNRVEVDVRGKRLRTQLSDLSATSDAAVDDRRVKTPARVSTPTRDLAASHDLIVIGTTVDDALARTEKFLDAAVLQDARTVRIVHGHGTGRLREALGVFLRQHPLVAQVTEAGEREGGRGATIVELRD